MDDGEMRRVFRSLAGRDDDTVRRALIAVGRASGDRMRNGAAWAWWRRRLDLPDEFGARLLGLLLPLLRYRPESVASERSEDDEILRPMLLLIPEEMQYRPALDALMRPEPASSVGRFEIEVWAAFGHTALAPLADLVRTHAQRTRPGRACARHVRTSNRT